MSERSASKRSRKGRRADARPARALHPSTRMQSLWTAERIRALRGERSRAELAALVGVTALTVYRWELPDDAAEAPDEVEELDGP